MLYDVYLNDFDGDEIVIIDLCITMCGCSAETAYKIVDNMPSVIAKRVEMKKAKKIKRAFENEGAIIDIETSKIDKESNTINEIFSGIEDDSEKEQEGINLEKVFEENSNLAALQENNYGEYSSDKISGQENKADGLQNAIMENATYNDSYPIYDESPVYKNLKGNSKQYITKSDIKNRNTNNDVSNDISFEMPKDEKKQVVSNKQYITKEYVENGCPEEEEDFFVDDGIQEFVEGKNKEFLNIGEVYDKNCMQINTFRNEDDELDSSEENMKKLYEMKGAKETDNKSHDDKWLNILNKYKNKDNDNDSASDYQKEQVECPQCGSTFVSAKRSQGFFGTKKIKYVCEACKHKF